MTAILWIFRNSNPGRVTRGFRLAQTASAAAMAFGHGLQDAAKTAGVVVLALNISGYHEGHSIPIWVLVLSAIVISAGTYAGGWRIMRTLGRRIIHLTPPQGFAAETTAASILYVAGLAFGAPISTTHTITSAIMGVGATKRLSAVRWSVAGNIVGAWVLTFPGAGLVAVARVVRHRASSADRTTGIDRAVRPTRRDGGPHVHGPTDCSLDCGLVAQPKRPEM